MHDIRNWLLQAIPAAPVSPKGGRPRLGKARVPGVFFPSESTLEGAQDEFTGAGRDRGHPNIHWANTKS